VKGLRISKLGLYYNHPRQQLSCASCQQAQVIDIPAEVKVGVAKNQLLLTLSGTCGEAFTVKLDVFECDLDARGYGCTRCYLAPYNLAKKHVIAYWSCDMEKQWP
jgi:hypothetical protein